MIQKKAAKIINWDKSYVPLPLKFLKDPTLVDNVREFLEKSRPAMQTVPDILNIAMMLETQALDLYSRYSQKIKYDQGKTILHEIADDEKAHLASLGKLMGTRV